MLQQAIPQDLATKIVCNKRHGLVTLTAYDDANLYDSDRIKHVQVQVTRYTHSQFQVVCQFD